MNDLGKYLVAIGLLLVVVGALLWSGVGRGWLGRLPGDIHVQRGQVGFYFPVMTSILLSIILTVVLWLIRKL